MIWPFNVFEELRDRIIAKPRFQAHRVRRYDERLVLFRLAGSGQTQTQQPVYGAFEGLTGMANLLLDKLGHVIVNGESSTHIMMLD